MGVADVKASVMSAFASCWAWYGAVMGPILLSDIGWVGALFQYRTTKYIVVDYWVVGDRAPELKNRAQRARRPPHKLARVSVRSADHGAI